MKSLMDDVRAFHEHAELPVATKPTKLSVDRVRLRLGLILEEFKELTDVLYPKSPSRCEALDIYCTYLDKICVPYGKDKEPRPLEESVEYFADVGDAIVDLIYFTVGMALEMGLPIDKVWAEVQRANMDKFPAGKVVRRPDGKILKPEGWRPPNNEEIIRQALSK